MNSAPVSRTKSITVAYSPDSDDAFMVYAWKNKLIDTFEFNSTFVSKDIQTLNEAAINGEYDVCAISVGVYPLISESYELMPVGASIGNGYGPKIVVSAKSSIESLEDLIAWSVRNPSNQNATLEIVTPGQNTSAYLAAKRLLPEIKFRHALFHEIEGLITSGQAVAGILIHELQLNPESRGLRVLADLGELWHRKFRLPLPLGANAIKRNLGATDVSRITSIYRESILWALKNRSETILHASQQALEGLSDQKLADRYIEMYVNHQSLDFDEATTAGIKLLLNN